MSKKKAAIANLPSAVNVSKTKNGAGEIFWRVRVGKRFTGGNVITRYFKTLDLARDWVFGDAQKEKANPGSIVQLERDAGALAFALTPDQLNEAANAFKRLAGKTTLTKAVDYYLKHANPEGGIRTLNALAEEFMITRKAMGIRDRTATQYASYITIINQEWGERNINLIKQADIEGWLGTPKGDGKVWSRRTKRNYLVTLSTLFKYAIDKKYLVENPAEKIQRPILTDKPPGILTPKQAELLMRIAEEEDREMVPGLAISLFAGLRRSEVVSLDWSEVDLRQKFIEVTAHNSKTRQRRLVTVQKNLLVWLKPFRKEKGPVTPTASQDVFGERLKDLVREKSATETTPARTAIIEPWPHNALRHSFGSYFYSLTKSEDSTASEMGNSPGVVFRHYREVVKPQETKKFWKIFPDELPSRKIIHLEDKAAA